MISDFDRAKAALDSAEYILIGAGAGLSEAAGLSYGGERFRTDFAPFIEKYHLTDMYSSGFYPFETQEERWAYWAEHIRLNRFDPPALRLYKELYELINDKDYFVITTNVDGQFFKSGFAKERIFAVQGDYGLIQCAKGCHNRLYDDERLVTEMIANTRDCKIPSALVPKCPVCGGNMSPHLRCDEYFVQNEEWYAASRRYEDFLKATRDRRTVFLELGVGFNTPGIIRFPFEQMVYENPSATLIRLNRDYPEATGENRDKTISFSGDMGEFIYDAVTKA